MAAEEELLLGSIDELLQSDEVRAKIRPVIERVRAELSRKTEALMAWEPIPSSIFGSGLPPQIKSSWVFILRAGVNTGAERHPNSHQRMISFEGSGEMQVGELDRLRSNMLVSDRDARLEKRWISIPQNVWHQPVVANEADWVVVSFHTVSAEELIEERPGESGTGETKLMKYLEESRK